MASIKYISLEGEISFADFLKREKASRKLTWDELSELCGVDRISAYALKETGGKPNKPPQDKFKTIVEALGHQVSDFTTGITSEEVPEKGTIEYESKLKELGEAILVHNTAHTKRIQRLSSTFIRAILGEPFYNKYGNSHQDRSILLDELHKLDSTYQQIKLQRQLQNKGSSSRLRLLPDGTKEEDIIMDALLELGDIETAKGHFTKGIYEHVHKRLNGRLKDAKMPVRSYSSIKYHTKKIWDGGIYKNITFDRGSPIPSQNLEDLLEARFDEINGGAPIVDTNYNVRITYLNYGPEYHQALLLYVMDPRNIQKLFGDAKVVGVTIRENDVDEKFVELYKRLVDESEIPENDDIVDFPDSWLSCDVVYQRTNGEYFLASIKQRAVDGDRFKNASLARKQLDASTAVLEGNIKYHNWDTGEARYDHVKGLVVAYEIENKLTDFLREQQGRDVFQISFDFVKQYLKEKL
jgi:transcriptional regulator with XRE-family HTH domain